MNEQMKEQTSDPSYMLTKHEYSFPLSHDAVVSLPSESVPGWLPLPALPHHTVLILTLPRGSVWRSPGEGLSDCSRAGCPHGALTRACRVCMRFPASSVSLGDSYGWEPVFQTPRAWHEAWLMVDTELFVEG